jgi:hypothetical protein
MGNWDEYEDNDEFEGDEQQGGIKAVRAAQRKAAKEAAELREANAKLQAQLSRFTLTSVLEEKGLNPRLAKWMVKDGVDGSDEAAVSTWLEENAEDFGGSSPSSEPEPENEGAAQLAAMRNAEQNALPSGKTDELIRRIKESDGSPAAINAVIMGAK